MNRREFVVAGVGGALGAPMVAKAERRTSSRQDDVRGLFPRAEREVFLNAAGGTPLGTFAEEGLRRYMDFQRLGRGEGRGEYVAEMQSEVRGLFGELIGARASEIALVHCTKAGEQIVLDGLKKLRAGGNVVTNDMHFSGSLHKYIGWQRAGRDVRIVRGQDWDVTLDAMDAAIDANTGLVAVTLVSNINGRIEPVRELAEIAHARGALLYADIIQGAGTVPMDMRALDIDFAACSGYKWLYGVHGVGFLYVRDELQGTALIDSVYPGHANANYVPWVERPDAAMGDFSYAPPVDASRYQPGHVSYLGYCGVYEGLKFIRRIGVEASLRHSVGLAKRLQDALDPDRFERITRQVERSPIITFVVRDRADVQGRLQAANIKVALSGNRMRVSPAVFNTEEDVDRLAEALA